MAYVCIIAYIMRTIEDAAAVVYRTISYAMPDVSRKSEHKKIKRSKRKTTERTKKKKTIRTN